MGAVTGKDGGKRPPQLKILGSPPKEIAIFLNILWDLTNFFRFFKIYTVKWPKSEEKAELGGRWAWRTCIPPPCQNLVAAPLYLSVASVENLHDTYSKT